MSTLRSVEPLTGSDAVLAALGLKGADPEPGDHGTDAAGNLYTWQDGGWVMTRQATHEPEPG